MSSLVHANTCPHSFLSHMMDRLHLPISRHYRHCVWFFFSKYISFKQRMPSVDFRPEPQRIQLRSRSLHDRTKSYSRHQSRFVIGLEVLLQICNFIMKFNQCQQNWRHFFLRAANHSDFWGRKLEEGLVLRLGTLEPEKFVIQNHSIFVWRTGVICRFFLFRI